MLIRHLLAHEEVALRPLGNLDKEVKWEKTKLGNSAGSFLLDPRL
jgi:hypothetical protein